MFTATALRYSTLAANMIGLISLSSLLGARPSYAAIINGDFGTGNFTGWTTLGNVSVDGNLQALLKTEAVNGNFAELETFLGLASGQLDSLGNGEAFEGSAIKQTFTANSGQVLSFNWNFLTQEAANSAFNDFSLVTINASPSELADTFSPSITSIALFARETGTQTFSYTIPTNGTYTLGIGVIDANDPGTGSGLLLDNVSSRVVSAPVPEPTSALGTLAFGVLAGAAWKRKQQYKARKNNM